MTRRKPQKKPSNKKQQGRHVVRVEEQQKKHQKHLEDTPEENTEQPVSFYSVLVDQEDEGEAVSVDENNAEELRQVGAVERTANARESSDVEATSEEHHVESNEGHNANVEGELIDPTASDDEISLRPQGSFSASTQESKPRSQTYDREFLLTFGKVCTSLNKHSTSSLKLLN